MKKAYFCTAEELEQRGKDNLPKQFQSGEHLIYSSPATLAFNSPGQKVRSEKSRTCSAGIDHADRGTGVLWKKYVHDQFNERI